MADRKRIQIERLFHRVADMAPEDRAAFLAEHCDDAAVREEVEKLLEFDAPQESSESDDRLRHAVVSPDAPTTAVSADTPFDRQRFVPGTMVQGRYRIVALLGRGGMGEVYRADDLQLGQSVALKFLPAELSKHPGALNHLRNEVRLSREVSHSNVCRVYDIGEADGQAFLSMQYVDGEDLASLLKRIGYLPQDRAVLLAHQLCLGLAAAHKKGVLHRDLKPSNVMVDGRGTLLITDFGLASLAGQVSRRDVRAGTPLYMAPEQLAGKDVTFQSDIYSLGLVLHEMFTGQPAYKADSIAELVSQRESGPLPNPSAHVAVLNPDVERVILRCLRTKPGDRPASALAVAAALPGGDPLAAALAAGETPSPEIVAASGGQGAMRWSLAAFCLALVVAGVVAASRMTDRLSLLAFSAPVKSPDALADRGRELISRLGLPAGEDRACGFDYDLRFFRTFDADAPWAQPGRGPSGLSFWYREGQEYLRPREIRIRDGEWSRGRVTQSDPQPSATGMVSAAFDPRGRVTRLVAVPGSRPSREAPTAVEWPALLARLDGDLEAFVRSADPVPANASLPFDVDERAAWRGVVYPEWDGLELRVEVGARHGELVYFEIAPPWIEPVVPKTAVPKTAAGLSWYRQLDGFLWLATLLASLVLAARNWRLGRVDRRGALRLAFVVFGLSLLAWLLQATHRPDLRYLDKSFSFALAIALQSGIRYWLFYVAFEPFARRFRPGTLIAWTRAFSGRLRDPLVGRHLLIGLGCGGGLAVVSLLFALTPGLLDADRRLPPHPLINTANLAGIGSLVGEIVKVLQLKIYETFVALMMLVVLRLLLRKFWIAVVACWFLLAAQLSIEHAGTNWALLVAVAPFCSILAAVNIYLLARFGLVAAIASAFALDLLLRFPVTFDHATWYAGGSYVVLGVLGAIGLFSFSQAVGKRQLATLFR